MELVSPVAWWSALVTRFTILMLVPSLETSPPDIPFVSCQSECHTFFSNYGIPLDGNPLPSTANGFWSKFSHSPPARGLQRSIMIQINAKRLKALTSTFTVPSPDVARLVSLSSKSSGLWLSTIPIHPTLVLSNTNFSLAGRLRLGLSPFDDLRSCSCGTSLTTHFISFPARFLPPTSLLVTTDSSNSSLGWLV